MTLSECRDEVPSGPFRRDGACGPCSARGSPRPSTRRDHFIATGHAAPFDGQGPSKRWQSLAQRVALADADGGLTAEGRILAQNRTYGSDSKGPGSNFRCFLAKPQVSFFRFANSLPQVEIHAKTQGIHRRTGRPPSSKRLAKAMRACRADAVGVWEDPCQRDGPPSPHPPAAGLDLCRRNGPPPCPAARDSIRNPTDACAPDLDSTTRRIGAV